MFRKFLASFVSVLIILIPIQVQAQELEGKVSSLSLDDPAPYAGVLLDPIAASKMIVDQKYLRTEIELGLRKEFQKELADKRLAFDLLTVEYNSLNKIHEETLSLKNQQINDLNGLLKEEISDKHTEWWALGGVVVGIILSVTVFYASVEVVK
jgi:hypothetical protein